MSRSALLQRLHEAPAPVISPSLLSSDLSQLKQEVADVGRAGVPMVHLDVMDGHFVPNLTFGPPVVRAVRRGTDLILDTHLMIANPGQYLDAFIEAGSDILTIHVEAVPDPRKLLARIRDADRLAGLVLNPGTSIDAIEPYVDEADMVLVMSVVPGFGGQAFMPDTLEKVRWLGKRLGPKGLIEIDGGINEDTIAGAAEAGAKLFVAGTAVFGSSDYEDAVGRLRRAATTGGQVHQQD